MECLPICDSKKTWQQILEERNMWRDKHADLQERATRLADEAEKLIAQIAQHFKLTT